MNKDILKTADQIEMIQYVGQFRGIPSGIGLIEMAFGDIEAKKVSGRLIWNDGKFYIQPDDEPDRIEVMKDTIEIKVGWQYFFDDEDDDEIESNDDEID